MKTLFKQDYSLAMNDVLMQMAYDVHHSFRLKQHITEYHV